jgi:hypothetical protein
MRVSALLRSEPSRRARSEARSRFCFRSASSWAEEAAALSAFATAVERVESWVRWVEVVDAAAVAWAWRFDISSSRDSIVAALEASWAARSVVSL